MAELDVEAVDPTGEKLASRFAQVSIDTQSSNTVVAVGDGNDYGSGSKIEN